MTNSANQMTAVAVVAAAAAFFATAVVPQSASAQTSGEEAQQLTGFFHVGPKGCDAGGGEGGEGCKLYFELHGPAAQAAYDSMTAKPMADACTGGQMKSDDENFEGLV